MYSNTYTFLKLISVVEPGANTPVQLCSASVHALVNCMYMACIPDVQELSKSWTGCPRGPWRERAAEELRPPSPVVLINVGCVPI